MAYFLKKSNNKKGTYLQIYFSFHDPDSQQTRHKSYRPIGYVHELIDKGITNPISHFQKEVDRLNQEFSIEKNKDKEKRISESTPLRHLGYFPIKSINDSLGVKRYLDLMQLAYDLKYNAYDLLSALVYARVIKPCSKHKTFHDILPNLFDPLDVSLDQLYDSLDFFGNEYPKIIEAYNDCLQSKYSLQTEYSYFDCTNFYFEIDYEDNVRKKGPSKERKLEPIIGMGLLLDAKQIPVGMKLYPGNESEQNQIGQVIKDMKDRFEITGKTIRVADKGLNSAKNIKQTLEQGDGYIFSKSVLKLPETEQTWILLDHDYVDIMDKEGKLLYRLKECIDDFPYSFYSENGKKIESELREKRVVTYNPKLAKKKREEIKKQVEKARKLCLSQAKKDQFGESAKYVNFESVNDDGELTTDNIRCSLNMKLIEKHWRLAGYNLIVTSEVHLPAQQIYSSYHNLWRIEESFRMMKSELDARPVYLQKESSIYAHFLICYLAVLLTRILQILILEDKHSYQEIIHFMRSFNVAQISPNKYINLAKSSKMFDCIEELTGLPIGHLNLNNSKIRKMMNYRF